MVQEKMAEPFAAVGVLVDSKGSVVPGTAASTYGDIEMGRVVLLAKVSGCAAGYYPVAAAQLQNLPEELRRKLMGGAGRPGYGDFEALALAPLRGEGARAAVPYLLVHAAQPVVQEGLRRQLAGGVSSPSDRAGYFAVVHSSYGARNVINDASELRVLQEDGKVVYQLDVTPTPQDPETGGGGGLFHAWMEHSADHCFDAAAFAREAGTPIFGKNRSAGLSMGALYDDGLVPAVENAVPLSVHNRAAEQGALYYDGLAPPAENVMAQLSSPYAVQDRVDAALGTMAGDPIAPGGKTAGADAGREHGGRGGGDNLSAVVGIVAASTAVTAVAAGAVGPVLALGFFMVLLGGVSLVMDTVRAP